MALYQQNNRTSAIELQTGAPERPERLRQSVEAAIEMRGGEPLALIARLLLHAAPLDEPSFEGQSTRHSEVEAPSITPSFHTS